MLGELFVEAGLGKCVAEAFDVLHGDDTSGAEFTVEARADGVYVVLRDGSRRWAKVRFATAEDFAADPYDSVLLRFETGHDREE